MRGFVGDWDWRPSGLRVFVVSVGGNIRVCVCSVTHGRGAVLFTSNRMVWTQVDRASYTNSGATLFFFCFFFFKTIPAFFSLKSVREIEKKKKDMEKEREKKNQIKKIKYGFSLEEKAKMKDDDHLSICPLRLPGKNFA